MPVKRRKLLIAEERATVGRDPGRGRRALNLLCGRGYLKSTSTGGFEDDGEVGRNVQQKLIDATHYESLSRGISAILREARDAGEGGVDFICLRIGVKCIPSREVHSKDKAYSNENSRSRSRSVTAEVGQVGTYSYLL